MARFYTGPFLFLRARTRTSTASLSTSTNTKNRKILNPSGFVIRITSTPN
jgi:hypothetical protein